MSDHSSRYLGAQIASLLAALRKRIRRYIVWDSLLAMAAVVLVAFWFGLAVDLLPVKVGGTEMPRSARAVLLLVVAVALLVVLIRLLIGRLARPLPDESLALLLERHHPRLGGRLVTAVQLGRPDRSGDMHAPALLRRVHQEAEAESDQLDPGKVFQWKPILRKTALVVPLALATLLLALFSPGSFGLAAGRLLLLTDQPWPRQASLEMVGVEIPLVTAAADDRNPVRLVRFEDSVARLPRGSSGTLRVRAAAEGAVVPDVCTVYYRTEDGTRGQANMRRVGRIVDGYQSFVLDGPPLSGLAGDLTLSVRGLDDRLDDLRIQAVQPPAVTELQVAARYPDYLRQAAGGDSPDLITDYQPGLRLREGSRVELIGQASKPLQSVDVQVSAGDVVLPEVSIRLDDDRQTFHLAIDDLRQPTTVVLVPTDQQDISAQAPFRYFLGVVADQQPEIELRLRGIGTAVTPIARIPIEGIAEDDYGLASTEVTIAKATDGQPEATAIEAHPGRDGRFEMAIDLRDLADAGRIPELAPGDAISLFGEASDRYDLGPAHQARSDIFRLELVTAEDLLALLERRELGLRARLEQTIDETRSLRDMLDLLRREGFSDAAADSADAGRLPSSTVIASAAAVVLQNATPPAQAASAVDSADASVPTAEDADRARQVLLLRIQQTALQTNKTSEELLGIAASVTDILEEMTNNRVDSVDRRERLGSGVGDPLRQIVQGPLNELAQQIAGIQQRIDDPAAARGQTAMAVETAEQVLLRLTEVLEKMLDLESYNEILDMVRQLIDNQDQLIEETQQEQKRRVMELFNSPP